MSDRLARVALTRLSEPGDLRLSTLVERLGATKLFQLICDERDLHGDYTDLAVRLRGLDPEQELEHATKMGIRFVCPGDDEWPVQVADLNRCEPLNGRGGAPIGLWAKGGAKLADACVRSVAVVGSRSATTYGDHAAKEISAHLAESGTTVISGAAFGIDQAAHRGALSARGPTVAVLACGVDRAYPVAHKNLLDYIADTGLIVSELPPGCAPSRVRFLSRNRVIAALSLGTVVVEAAVRSGALNTANWATRLNRLLMGVPGPVTSAPSVGVHELIRTRGAALVTCGADVLELVAPVGSFLPEERRGEERPRDRLTTEEMRVIDAVPVRAAAPASSVARTAGLAERETVAALTRLRDRQLVEEVANGWRLSGAAL